MTFVATNDVMPILVSYADNNATLLSTTGTESPFQLGNFLHLHCIPQRFILNSALFPMFEPPFYRPHLIRISPESTPDTIPAFVLRIQIWVSGGTWHRSRDGLNRRLTKHLPTFAMARWKGWQSATICIVLLCTWRNKLIHSKNFVCFSPPTWKVQRNSS